MHDQYMIGLERRSRLAFEDKRRRLRRRARAGIDTLLATVDTVLDADREAPISSLYKTVSEDGLREAAANCRAFASLEERGLVDELTARYGDLRKYWPAFLRLPFEAAAGSESLLAAVEVARKLDAGGSEKVLDDAPRHFIPAVWQGARPSRHPSPASAVGAGAGFRRPRRPALGRSVLTRKPPPRVVLEPGHGRAAMGRGKGGRLHPAGYPAPS